MRSAGCVDIIDIEDLAVMGLVELVAHLPRLLRLRRRLRRYLLRLKPDLVVGIDAPDFNLGVERYLRRRGVATAHYVSPSVWAWRPKRVQSVDEAARAVLCLLPFEPAYYRNCQCEAVYVGHPLADQLTFDPDPGTARRNLALPVQGRKLALLPGSRHSEIAYLFPLFVAVFRRLLDTYPELEGLVPVARSSFRVELEKVLDRNPDVKGRVRLIEDRAREILSASDAVLLASGTATLEAALLGRPMVVSYHLNRLSAWVLRHSGLLVTKLFALPNLLLGRPVVPELLQEAAQIEPIVTALKPLLDLSSAERQQQIKALEKIHSSLRKGAGARAAQVLLSLCNVKPTAN